MVREPEGLGDLLAGQVQEVGHVERVGEPGLQPAESAEQGNAPLVLLTLLLGIGQMPGFRFAKGSWGRLKLHLKTQSVLRRSLALDGVEDFRRVENPRNLRFRDLLQN